MPKYSISTTLSITVYTEVEADTKEEALKIAFARRPASLAHNAVLDEEDEAWLPCDSLEGELAGQDQDGVHEDVEVLEI